MTNPSDRVLRVESLVASPGACALCGKSKSDEGFVTFDNLDFEWYGSLAFCADCTGDIARAMGYLHPDIAKQQSEQIESLTSEVATLREAIVLMENTLDNLTSVRDLRSSGILSDSRSEPSVPLTDSDSVSGSDDSPEGESESVGPVNDGQDSDVTESERPADESTNEPRRDDLHGLASIDELLV